MSKRISAVIVKYWFDFYDTQLKTTLMMLIWIIIIIKCNIDNMCTCMIQTVHGLNNRLKLILVTEWWIKYEQN